MKMRTVLGIVCCFLILAIFSSCAPITGSTSTTYPPPIPPDEHPTELPNIEKSPVWTGGWLCEYNQSDTAQIIITNETATGFDFMFLLAEYVQPEYMQDKYLRTAGFYGTAVIESDDTARFVNTELDLSLYKKVEGTFRLRDNDSLSATFDTILLENNAPGSLQTEYKKSGDGISPKLPLISWEIELFGTPLRLLPMPALVELLGEPIRTEKLPYESDFLVQAYYEGIEARFALDEDGHYAALLFLKTTKPGFSMFRGVEVGDSMESVLAKFPLQASEKTIENEDGSVTTILYGLYEFLGTGGYLTSLNGKPTVIGYDNEMRVTIYLDNDERVSAISYYIGG